MDEGELRTPPGPVHAASDDLESSVRRGRNQEPRRRAARQLFVLDGIQRDGVMPLGSLYVMHR
jgi:hypothetical protein